MIIEQIIETAVETAGYELIAVEYVPQRKSSLLRIFIDKEAGISIEDCEKASRQISALLDVEDPIQGHYTLEVSSPGIERPLVKEEHFRKYCGERVKITTHNHHLGRKRFTGLLTKVDECHVIIDVDGEIYELPFADINKARLFPQWT